MLRSNDLQSRPAHRASTCERILVSYLQGTPHLRPARSKSASGASSLTTLAAYLGAENCRHTQASGRMRACAARQTSTYKALMAWLKSFWIDDIESWYLAHTAARIGSTSGHVRAQGRLGSMVHARKQRLAIPIKNECYSGTQH